MIDNLFKPVLLAVAALTLAGCGHQPMESSIATADYGLTRPEPTEFRDSDENMTHARTAFHTTLLGERDDDLAKAKVHFRNESYGLAEKHYRRAVEQAPNDTEAWIGLAASYDHLGRFDLADRAYEAATKLAGPSPVILNNMGYSYLLREERDRAQRTLERALNMDPGNTVIRGNLDLLQRSRDEAKGVG